MVKLASPNSIPNYDPQWLRIPRRPKWKAGIDTSELHRLEQEAFLEWRRGLARLENGGHFILTPFERNLEVWRQLWRVVESCAVLIQIVDARNPMLYYCGDLQEYAREIHPEKKIILLINKADYLSFDQCRTWGEYLKSVGLEFVFYSAKSASESVEETQVCPDLVVTEEEQCDQNDYKVLSRAELLQYFRCIANGGKIGMVGYPNVGKSSTINSLAGAKKVAVASTPGKTKHFQTVVLENGVVLFDCPGLVFPNFAVSKGDLILNGILPIDQLREWINPTDLLLERIPRNIIERTYGIEIPRPSMDELHDRKPTASELLSCFAVARGFRTSFHGNPDESRAARIILKDYVNGKLLYCCPPPCFEGGGDAFNIEMWRTVEAALPSKTPKNPIASYSPNSDVNLLSGQGLGVFISGMKGTSQYVKPSSSGKKHYKMKKRH